MRIFSKLTVVFFCALLLFSGCGPKVGTQQLGDAVEDPESSEDSSIDESTE